MSPLELQQQAERTVSMLGDERITRVGVDAVHIPTWERHIQLGGPKLLARIYTPTELAFAHGRGERLAARIAAKEAVLKMLGTGVRGISLLDVEVVSTAQGEPRIVLHGPALERAEVLRISHIVISLAHENEYAIAFTACFAQLEGEIASNG